MIVLTWSNAISRRTFLIICGWLTLPMCVSVLGLFMSSLSPMSLAARRVGWAVRSSMTTEELPLEALNQALGGCR